MKKFYLVSVFILFISLAYGQSKYNTELNWVKINPKVENPAKSRVVTDWITYSGEPDNSIGVGGAADFGCFMHIPITDLAAHDGRQIQQVKIQISQPENIASAELRIYEEASTGTPGTPVYTQSFTPNPDGTAWTVIDIIPYNIDATQELMVGYFINATAGYPASCDAGPANTNGNLMIWAGSWVHLTDLNSTLTGNWNIQTGIGDAENNDVAMYASTVSDIVTEGDVDITGTIANFGSNQITTFDINWQIDNGTVNTENITGLTLDFGQTYNFTHGTQWNASVGSYNLKMWVSNMNGIGDDNNPANDTIIKAVNVIPSIDIALSQILTPMYALYGDVEILGNITNVGGANITSYDITYNIDGGTESATYSVTGIDIPYNGTHRFIHNIPYNFNADGVYAINVTLSNVNVGGETNLANNTLSKNINVDDDYIIKQTLFEEFTSSTCGPCASVNANTLEGFFAGLSTDEYTLIKYQMNWPGVGDSYYTAEGGVRRSFYSVSGVPSLKMDAVDVDYGSVLTQGTDAMQSYYDANKVQLTDMSVSSIHEINEADQTVRLQVTINSKNDYSGLTLYAGVYEKITTGNVASNGETEFHNVMMKMIPDASGRNIDLVAGTPSVFNMVTSLAGTNIEEYSDLGVIVFVQKNTTKEVYQSANSVVGTIAKVNSKDVNFINIYPNPAKNIINIRNAENANIKIYDLIGKLVLSTNNVDKDQSINISNLKDGTYFVRIFYNNIIKTEKITISR